MNKTEKTVKTNKKRGKSAPKSKARPDEFWVVAWAMYDENESCMTCGTLRDIFSSYEKAMKELMDCARQDVLGEITENDREEWPELYGSNDADHICRQRIKPMGCDCWKVENDNTETQYALVKYSMKYVK